MDVKLALQPPTRRALPSPTVLALASSPRSPALPTVATSPAAAMPPPPPTPIASFDAESPPTNVTHAITLKGAELAFCILSGKKTVENRWRPMARGWYAIHVGKGDLNKDNRDIMLTLTSQEEHREIELETPKVCPKGHVAGLAYISHTLPISVMYNKSWALGPFCNVISKVAVLKTPVKCTGQQGFWRLPFDVAQAVRGQLSSMTYVSTGFEKRFPPDEAALSAFRTRHNAEAQEELLAKKRARDAGQAEEEEVDQGRQSSKRARK